MPTSADSRVLLNNGTEMTGYPPAGLPNGPINDPMTADQKTNPQVPARVKVVSLLATGGPPATALTLTWAVNKNVTDSLGWSNSAPSPVPQPNPNASGYAQSWVDQWTSPYVNPGLPAPDSFNIYQVSRLPGQAPIYTYVKNVSGGSSTSTTLTLPAANQPGTYEYTVTAVVNPSSTKRGGEGAFPTGLNPQYVVPVPSDVVLVTNPGDQTNVLGDTVSLQIVASDTTAGALTYSASNLPTGLSISSTTGIISGTATTITTTRTVLVTVANSVTGAQGSQQFAWTVNNVPAPAAPGTPAPSSITSTGVTLTWTATTGSPAATGYNVYDTTGGTSTKLTGSPLSSGTLTYNATNGAANSTHTYAVTAINGPTAESTPTANASVLFLPGLPTGVTNGTPTTTTAALSWTAPTGGAASYNVYDTTSARPGTKLNGSPITTTGYTVTNGVTGTTRKYAVTSVNATGETAETTDLSVTFA